jgi:23S rRNA (cytosine1962-C5)-methyltransferase
MHAPQTLIAHPWPDYALLDSGNGQKLERLGRFSIIRPEPQAMWQPSAPALWDKADGTFTGGQSEDDDAAGRWTFRTPPPETFDLAWQDVRFQGRFTAFRHLAVFPEQAAQWATVRDICKASKKPLKVLNLFGYTGLMTLAAASGGAEVTHVDASKKSITWARDNQILSGLEHRPIRWLVDDAMKFVAREVRRGTRYDGIVLDPPKYGRGPKNEIWRLFDDLPEMVAMCAQLLSDEAKFMILTAYAARLSSLSLNTLVREAVQRPGRFEYGELALEEEVGKRLLSVALYARWMT